MKGMGGAKCDQCGHFVSWGWLHDWPANKRVRCPECKGHFFNE